MNILLHVCCGPCLLYPLAQLREKGFSVTGFFHNPNIHPYREFRNRLQTAVQTGEEKKMELEVDADYGLTTFLRQVVFHESNRCTTCVDMRLERTAQKAVQRGIEQFTTSLLYSKYQNHAYIRKSGERIAQQYGLHFYYEDFRVGWQQGIDEAIALQLYRQPYCGCVYSEQERYDKKLRKERRKSESV